MNTSYEPGAPGGDEHFIPLSVPVIEGNEWKYVEECLTSGWVSSVGSYVTRFEETLAGLAGVPYAVATVNGTAALHIALLVAGVEPDDEVLVSNLTFIAPVNAVRYANAWPVLVDAEPRHWQMDVDLIRDFLKNDCELRGDALVNRRSGRRVRAILPVHMLGHPVDMDPLLELGKRFGLAVVEDATESLGSTYRGRPTGSLGTVGCYSFNGNKIVTTGGGGVVVTADLRIAERARYLTTQAKDDSLEYIHGAVGYNYRLTNVLAAIGLAQMELLERYVAARRRIAERYDEAFSQLPGLASQPSAEGVFSNRWLYTVLVDEDSFGMDSRALLAELAEEGIQSRPLWHPIHLNKPFRETQVLGGEVSIKLNQLALSLPCSANLTEAQQERVIAAVRAARRVQV
jgi:perosamine synthetase